MAEGMPHGELVRRAFKWILEERACNCKKTLRTLLDEAGMRFNLTPKDDTALYGLLKEQDNGTKTGGEQVEP